MEVFGVPATAPNIAIALAGIIATLWGGSKVPWKAALAGLAQKIAGLFSGGEERHTAVTEDTAYELEDPGDDVMIALRVLHEHAVDADSHKLISAVEADFWQKRSKPAEPVAVK